MRSQRRIWEAGHASWRTDVWRVLAFVVSPCGSHRRGLPLIFRGNVFMLTEGTNPNSGLFVKLGVRIQVTEAIQAQNGGQRIDDD